MATCNPIIVCCKLPLYGTNAGLNRKKIRLTRLRLLETEGWPRFFGLFEIKGRTECSCNNTRPISVSKYTNSMQKFQIQYCVKNHLRK